MKWICTLSLSHTTTFVDKQMVQSDVSVSSCLLRKYRYFYCHKALLSSFLKKKTPRNLTGESRHGDVWIYVAGRKEEDWEENGPLPVLPAGASSSFIHLFSFQVSLGLSPTLSRQHMK